MADLDEISRAIGALQASQTAIQANQVGMQADIAEMKTTLSEARGGWKTLLMGWGAAGAIGALVAKFMPWGGS